MKVEVEVKKHLLIEAMYDGGTPVIQVDEFDDHQSAHNEMGRRWDACARRNVRIYPDYGDVDNDRACFNDDVDIYEWIIYEL